MGDTLEGSVASSGMNLLVAGLSLEAIVEFHLDH